MQSRIARRWLPVLGAMLAVLTIGVACKKDEVAPEPEVATMRLTVGTQTVNVASNGTVTGGPITISANATISAEWLKDDGTPEDLVTDAEFELRGTTDNAAVVTFTRSTTNAFAGTLSKVATGSTAIRFALYHLEEMHEDFGPHPVPITVN